VISNVPNHQQLRDTAEGWMRLAWSNTIECIREIDEHSEFLDLMHEDLKDDKRSRYLGKVVMSQRFMLNNAVTLLQQSLELFLKSIIAETSPFLLVSGDPGTWPKPDEAGVVDFSRFRTIDAIHLCRVVNTVGNRRLSDEFMVFFEEQRKLRNYITHLDTGSLFTEATTLLVSILLAHSLMFEGQRWQEFRTKLATTDKDSDKDEDDDEFIYDTDVSHDIYLSEIDMLIERLTPRDLRKFLGFDRRKRRFACRVCWNMTSKQYDGQYRYIQKQPDGRFVCLACLTTFADEDTYDKSLELM